MSSIQYACSLNNQGVGLLLAGESSRAVRVFQSALGLLKAALHKAENNTCTAMDQSDDDVSLPFCESTSTVTGFQGLHGYVYDHGIMIPGNVDGETEVLLSIYIAIVLFNLALAYHHQGRLLGHEKTLKHASRLYSLTTKILSESILLGNMSATILTLLALNNKSQIHYDQYEHIESVDCLKAISKIMGHVKFPHVILNQKDYNGLLLNTVLLVVPTAAHAA